MKLTVLGMMVLPLSLLWSMQPIRLIQLALVAAIFEAGAAVVIGGSFGLPLAMVPGLMFIVYVCTQYAMGMRYPAEGLVLRTILPLLALLLYALLSVMVLPDVFAGKIMVWPQKGDLLQPSFVPLAFSSGNVTQLTYLAMNVVMAVATALFITRSTVSYNRVIGAYLLGGYLVVGIAFWQFASRVAGVPFPDDIFYSNPGWAIVEQSMGNVPRIQGSFSEPAGLAFYLSGLCFCCLWLTARGYNTMRPGLLLFLAMLAMLLSTSTTGLAILGIGLPIMLLMAGSDLRSFSRLARTLAGLMLVATIVITPIFILKPALIKSIDTVVESTLTKGDSDSYEARTGIDTAALGTMTETYGLGVGWGSFRTSSLLPGLVANAGAFGIAAVLWLILRIRRLTQLAATAAPRHPARILVDGFSAALFGQLVAALMSAPTIGSLAFFLQLGCVIGAASRMSVERKRPTVPSLLPRVAW